jgi:soluble lytic murein transglycosylase
MLSPRSVNTVNNIYLNPGKYLNDKLTAMQPKTRELVSLALIRLAYLDPEEAAKELDKLRWKAPSSRLEERSWIWGVIGKRAGQKLSDGCGQPISCTRPGQATCTMTTWPGRRVRHCAPALGSRCHRHHRHGRQPSAMTPHGSTGAPVRCCGSPPKCPCARRLTLAGKHCRMRGFYEQLALEELGQRITVPPSLHR